MIDGLNSGLPAFFNPGGEKANKLEQAADKLLWAPREVWANRTVKVVDSDQGVSVNTNRAESVTSGVKNVVKTYTFPINVFVVGGYGVLCVLTSPLLLVGGLLKGIAMATSSESRLKMKVVQQQLKFEGLQQRKAQLTLANEKLTEAIKKELIQKKVLPQCTANEISDLIDLAALPIDVGISRDQVVIIRSVPGMRAELRKVESLAAQAEALEANMRKTIEAQKVALTALNAIYQARHHDHPKG